MNDLGGPKEFAARRAELAAKLKTGYVLLFAKTQEPPAAHYREDNDFYYYTGLSDPGVEDTILITANGPEVLSSAVPKEISEVEKLVGSAPAPQAVK